MAGDRVRGFQKWLSGRAPDTRRLGELIVASVVPKIIGAGFDDVGRCFGDEASPVQGGEIRFEREIGDSVDVIHIYFDKYASPRFQIGFSRRLRSDVRHFVRSGHLVKRSSQHYYEWGKPRWMPLWLWSERQARRAIQRVSEGIEQIVRFLEDGHRGPQISRQVSGRMS